MPGLPRYLPDVGVSRTLQARCAALHFLSHHRDKGPIPHEFRKAIGNRIYGCDDCLAVCPWNKFAQTGRETKLAARQELRAPALADLARLDDAAFRARFTKSPVKRIGRDRFVRNVLIAIGNSNDGALAAEAERLLDDESPLVRGAAVWALAQLIGREAFEARAAGAMAAEPDETVRAEWRARAEPSSEARSSPPRRLGASSIPEPSEIIRYVTAYWIARFRGR